MAKYRAKKRVVKKRKYQRRRKAKVMNMGSGFTWPDRLLTVFNYADDKLYSAPQGFASSNSYRLNDLFDSDITGTGTTVLDYHQLLGGDLYRLSCVYGAKVSVTLINETTSPTSVQVAYGIKDQIAIAGGPSVADEVRSQKNNWVCNLGASTGGNNIKTYKFYVPIYKLFGISKQQLTTDDKFFATYGSSLNGTDNLGVITINALGGVAGGTPNAGSIVGSVKIKYYAVLRNRAHATTQ